MYLPIHDTSTPDFCTLKLTQNLFTVFVMSLRMIGEPALPLSRAFEPRGYVQARVP